ncbi:MAG: hypothetical protein K2X77_30980 [Candidatus Obscuribacterales bacterium]|nr:hypothetical protein [Candidatus Obscuribacterales bacterium]
MEHFEPKNINSLLEVEKPKSNVLSDFVQSTINAGVVSPIRGVAQIVDHAAGTSADKSIQKGFEAVGIKAPEHAEFGTASWYVQQLGNAAGMTIPFMLSRAAIQGCASKIIGEAAVYKSALDIGSTHTLRQFALHEGATSAAAGLFYGTMLTPTNEKNVGELAFIGDRLKAGIGNVAVFGTLGLSAPYMTKALGSAATAVEQSALSNLAKSPLSATLRGPLLAGTLSGLPAGLVGAEVAALSDNRLVPTAGEFKESLVGMAFVGGAFGTRHWLSAQREGSNITNGRYLTDKVGLTEPANAHKASFHLVEGQAELSNLQRSIASGAEKSQAEVIVRPELETVTSGFFGKQFTKLGDARAMLLDHRSGGVIKAGSIGNVNLLATCCNLEPALAKRDVFRGRGGAGKDGTVWLQSSPENPGKFTLSLDRNVKQPASESISGNRNLVEVPLGERSDLPPKAVPPTETAKNPAMRVGEGPFSVLGKTLTRPGDSTILFYSSNGTRTDATRFDTTIRFGIGSDKIPFAKVELGDGFWSLNGTGMAVKRAYTVGVGDTISMNPKVNFRVEPNPIFKDGNALRLVQENSADGVLRPAVAGPHVPPEASKPVTSREAAVNQPIAGDSKPPVATPPVSSARSDSAQGSKPPVGTPSVSGASPESARDSKPPVATPSVSRSPDSVARDSATPTEAPKATPSVANKLEGNAQQGPGPLTRPFQAPAKPTEKPIETANTKRAEKPLAHEKESKPEKPVETAKPWSGSPELNFKVGEILPTKQLERMVAVPSDGIRASRPTRFGNEHDNIYRIDPVQVRNAYSKTGERFTFDETGKIIDRQNPVAVQNADGKQTYVYKDQSTVTWQSENTLLITKQWGNGDSYTLSLTKNANGTGTIEYPSGLTKTLNKDGSVREHHPKEGWTKDLRIAEKYFGREVTTTTYPDGVKITEFENSLGKETLRELPNGSKERRFHGRIEEFPKQVESSEMIALTAGKSIKAELGDAQVSVSADGKITLARSNSNKVFDLGEKIESGAIRTTPESDSLSIYAKNAKGEKLQIIITENDRVVKINRSVASQLSMVEYLKDPLAAEQNRDRSAFSPHREKRVEPTEKITDSVLKEGIRLASTEFGGFGLNSIALKDGRVITFDNRGMIHSVDKPSTTAKSGERTIHTYAIGPTQKTVLTWEGDSVTLKPRLGGTDSQLTKDALGRTIETYNGNKAIRFNDNSERILRNDGIEVTRLPGSFKFGDEFTTTKWANGKLLIEQARGDYTSGKITHHANRSGIEIGLGPNAGAIEITGTGEVRVLLPVKPPSDGGSRQGLRPYPDPVPRPFPDLVPRMF